MIIDLRGVVSRHGNRRKEVFEQSGARLGKLVENERTARRRGKNREEPRSGRGLQHTVGRRDRGGGKRRKTKRNGRRELLERLALLGAARMRRQQLGKFRQRRKSRGRSRRFAEQRLAIFSQEQDRRDLTSLIGGFPAPRAGTIRCAERVFHDVAQHGGVDLVAAFETRNEKLRGGENSGGAVSGRGIDGVLLGRKDGRENIH